MSIKTKKHNCLTAPPITLNVRLMQQIAISSGISSGKTDIASKKLTFK